MKITIICSVRNATPEYRERLEDYVGRLEQAGNEVYLPHRDNDQKDTGINILTRMRERIQWADRIDIFYNSDSQGTHFDMGGAWAFRKTIKVVENIDYGEGKSFPRFLDEWEGSQK